MLLLKWVKIFSTSIFDKCKYAVKENKTKDIINDELNLDSSDDEFDGTDGTNETDKIDKSDESDKPDRKFVKT